MNDYKEVLLSGMLATAVPMVIDDIKRSGLTMDDLLEEKDELAQFICEHGDNILFHGKKKGDTANAFVKLARALAILSFVPGGVRFMGERWESHLEKGEAFNTIGQFPGRSTARTYDPPTAPAPSLPLSTPSPSPQVKSTPWIKL